MLEYPKIERSDLFYHVIGRVSEELNATDVDFFNYTFKFIDSNNTEKCAKIMFIDDLSEVNRITDKLWNKSGYTDLRLVYSIADENVYKLRRDKAIVPFKGYKKKN